MYSNGVEHDRGEDGILQQKRMILKNRMKLQMEIGRRGILPEEPMGNLCKG